MHLKFIDDPGCFSQQVFHNQWKYQKYKSEFQGHFSRSRLTHVSTGDTEMGKKSGVHFIGPGNRKKKGTSAVSWRTSEHVFHYCQNFCKLISAAPQKC